LAIDPKAEPGKVSGSPPDRIAPMARLRPLACAAALLAGTLLSVSPGHAQQPAPAAAACTGNPNALGTARIMAVNTRGGFEVGTKIYRTTLPLQPREIILTFDDGPFGATTDRILAALAAECVKATFFVVGSQAATRPEQLRRIAAAGHTVAHHTMTHPILRDLPIDAAKTDMKRGWQTVDRILYGTAGEVPRVPFFRYPGFAQTRDLTRWLAGMNVGVFGADFWGSDWTPITSDALLAQVLTRAEASGGGIMLLHDIHRHTADMVPAMLREFKRRGFSIVHMVPAAN
jgi:peptidoglycan/xylan/chitin deacetylase (PgdA/CDA1 family)